MTASAVRINVSTSTQKRTELRFCRFSRWRLRERATESSGEIHERIELARKQLEQAGEFDHVIENDELDRAVGELTTLVRGLLGATATMPRR